MIPTWNQSALSNNKMDNAWIMTDFLLDCFALYYQREIQSITDMILGSCIGKISKCTDENVRACMVMKISFFNFELFIY